MNMKYEDILDLVQIMYKAKKNGYFEQVGDLYKPLSDVKEFNQRAESGGKVIKSGKK